ncbi:GtrA family protein [Candidatus Parcubacteria bacterium]|nr:MAG: GtrA family protein [Candidatus Parcubacteria bacterium]
MQKRDVFGSIVIGIVAGFLMYLIGTNLPDLAPAVRDWLWVLPIGFPVATLVAMVVGSFIGRRIPVVYQLTKFLLVGGQNFLIDLGVLNLLIASTGIEQGTEIVVFKAVSFVVAVIASFFWNKFWTFRSLSVERAGFQFFEFFIVSAIGLGINTGSFALANNVVGAQYGLSPEAWANVSAGIAAIIGLMWNFIGYKFIVFRR